MPKANFKDKEFFEICLASLLHDIGKFAFRCLPERELYGEQTSKRVTHEDLNNRILRDFLTDLTFRGFWAKNYNIENSCVVLGDWISAQERDTLDEEDRMPARETPLKTIFSSIIISDKDENGNEREFKIDDKFWAHKNLSLDVPKESDYTGNKNAFDESLYRKFLEELDRINGKYDIEIDGDRRALFRELLDLLRKYCSYIPSAAWYSQPDIDLYNHSKMACAVTACLYKYYSETDDKESISKLRGSMEKFFGEQIEIKKPSTEDDKKKGDLLEKKKKDEFYKKPLFLIIKGDFSGIQNFVSTISTSKASAHLKARSFYIAYLNKIIPVYLSRELGLPETNVIYSSGGNFEILADNTSSTKNIMKKLSTEINEKLLERFGISIFLSVRYKEMSALDFDRQMFYKFMGNNHDDNWETEGLPSKIKKFDGHNVFIVKEPKKLCSVCYNELLEEGETTTEDSEKKCTSCENLEKLRTELKKWNKDNKIYPLPENCKGLFDLREDMSKALFYDKNITKINSVDGIYEIFPIGYFLDISELAKEAEKRTGKRKIGAMKLDVDNLGNIFKEGLNGNEENGLDSRLTLSTFARLSFDISLFFEGIVCTLRESDKYKDEIYLLYSGGDDTFILGSWDKVIDFAKDLNNYFRIYVNHHPGITISASYGIYDEKYPVKKIFEDMEEGLEKAKGVPGKSCITIFGVPIKWDYFEDFKDWNLCLEGNEKQRIDNIENEFADIQKKIKSFSQEKSFELFFKISSLYSFLAKNTVRNVPRTFLMRSILLCMRMSESMEGNGIDINPAWQMEYYLKRAILSGDLKEKLLGLWKDLYNEQLRGYPKENKNKDIMKIVAVASKVAQLNSGVKT